MKRYIQLYILQVIFLILSSHFTHFRKVKCTQNMVITLRLYSSVFAWSIFYISYSVTKSCLTLGNPMDCILPGSSVHEIFQARILEWVAIPFSGNLSYPGMDPASPVSPTLAGGFFTTRANWEAHNIYTLVFKNDILRWEGNLGENGYIYMFR